MSERLDAAMQAAAGFGRIVGNKVENAKLGAYRAGYRAADRLTQGYQANLTKNDFMPDTSRYVGNFLHPESIDEAELARISEVQAAHGIEPHLPEVTEDERILLLQAVHAYMDVCRGAAHDHIDPATNETLKSALMKLESAMFFVFGFPEAVAVNTIGPQLAQKLGLWGGRDDEWGEVWLKSGPMAGDPDHFKGPYHATYNDWGVWFREETKVRDSNNPGKTYEVDDGRLIEPEPAQVKPQKEKKMERRSTTGGAPRMYDEILNEKRHNNKDKRPDADLRREATDEYNGQFKGKRKRGDDW